MKQSDKSKHAEFIRAIAYAFSGNDTSPVFETVLGESVPPGVKHMTVANPLTVAEQAHTASNEVQQLAYQNAFTAVEWLTDTAKARDKTIEELQKDVENLRGANTTWAQGARDQNEEISKLQDQNDDLRLEFSCAKKGADDADDTAREYERRALLAEASIKLFLEFQEHLEEIHKNYTNTKRLAMDSKEALAAIKEVLDEADESICSTL